jgi:AbrB family looped-hinge helix DNA binding protein
MTTTANKEGGAMSLVKVLRTGQVTLPAPMRRRLELAEGALLEAEEVEGGILLRPVSVVDRKKAWREVMEIVERDKWIGPEPRPSPEEEEQMIFDEVAAARNEA